MPTWSRRTPKTERPATWSHFRLSGRLGSDFLFSFRAVRSIPHQGTPFHLTLPVMEATVRPASTVVVADAENVKSTLDPLPETAVRPIAPSGAEALDVPEAFRGLRQVALRVDSPVQAFDASVAVQKQQIETESTAQVEVQEGRLQVTQRISYHVSYERLAEAVLVLPKQLRRGDVQLYIDRSDAEFEAIPTWTPGDADSGDVARIAFEPHRIGTFDLLPAILCRWPSRRRTKRRPKWRCRSCGRATRPSRRCGSSCGHGTTPKSKSPTKAGRRKFRRSAPTKGVRTPGRSPATARRSRCG